MSKKLATISGSENAIQQIIEETTLAGKSSFENAYLNISDGELNILTSVSGGTIAAYGTFGESDFLTKVSVSDDVKEHSDDENPTVEALIDIDMFQSYFDLVRGGDGTMRLEFHGELESRLASTLEMYGRLNSGIYLPESDSILEKMPLWLPSKFNEDNVWSTDEATFDTHINTDVETVKRIIEAVDADEVTGIDNYPIVVENGEFTLDVTDEQQRNWITGSLDGDSDAVSGEDVANLYGRGFEPVFQVLSGDVRLSTAPDDGSKSGVPLVVVKEKGNGVIRHVIGNAGAL